MLGWALIGLGVAAGGARWLRARRSNRTHRALWPPLLTAVAARYAGRASSAGDSPGLRGTVDGTTVTLTLYDTQQPPDRVRAEAEVALPDTNNIFRLHVGWDIIAAPQDLDHVPPVDAGFVGLDGDVAVRADHPAVALRFLAATALDLIDVRRESLARALEVRVRGGYLQLTLHGMDAHEAAIDRVLKVAASLAHHI